MSHFHGISDWEKYSELQFLNNESFDKNNSGISYSHEKRQWTY